MTYRIELLKQVVKALKKVPKADRDKIARKIDMLKEQPIPIGAKKLKGTNLDFYRIRQGDWRIIYTIEDGELLIVIVALGHRRDIYR